MSKKVIGYNCERPDHPIYWKDSYFLQMLDALLLEKLKESMPVENICHFFGYKPISTSISCVPWNLIITFTTQVGNQQLIYPFPEWTEWDPETMSEDIWQVHGNNIVATILGCNF